MKKCPFCAEKAAQTLERQGETSMYRLVTGTILSALVVGCGGSSMAPSTIDGNYIGTIVDSVLGNGTVRLMLTSQGPDAAANGTDVSGSWSTTFANAGNNDNGTVLGLFHDPSLDFTFTNGSTCTVQLGRLTRTAASLNGLYEGCKDATGQHEGTMALMKR